jgi:hypothetical protein
VFGQAAQGKIKLSHGYGFIVLYERPRPAASSSPRLFSSRKSLTAQAQCLLSPANAAPRRHLAALRSLRAPRWGRLRQLGGLMQVELLLSPVAATTGATVGIPPHVPTTPHTVLGGGSLSPPLPLLAIALPCHSGAAATSETPEG